MAKGCRRVGGRVSTLRRRFAPQQLRHAHAVELAHEGVPLDVIQRQLGHTKLGVASSICRASTNAEIIATVDARTAPMLLASTGLRPRWSPLAPPSVAPNCSRRGAAPSRTATATPTLRSRGRPSCTRQSRSRSCGRAGHRCRRCEIRQSVAGPLRDSCRRQLGRDLGVHPGVVRGPAAGGGAIVRVGAVDARRAGRRARIPRLDDVDAGVEDGRVRV
jgi:Phage integrase family